MTRRVLSGGIAQESHSFNPVLATRGDFEVTEGRAAIAAARGTNTTLGGVVDAAKEAGVEVVVPAMFRAQSGGPVEEAVFAEIRDRMCDAAARGDFDAVVLPLHGGMLTPSLADPEGRLFADLRAVVGPDVPITAAFDLHAHVDRETVRHCDYLTAYRTNPHHDQAETGRRAMQGALRMLDGTFDPVCVGVRVPMLTLGHDRTDESPLRELHARAASLCAGGGVDDISIFNAQQFLDVPGLGQTVLAYANGTENPAAWAATEIAGRLWDARDRLIGHYPSLSDILADAGSPDRRRPMVIGDQGDRVAAGGPGDSTFVLHALLDGWPALPAAVPIADAAAVAACLAAGVGSVISIAVGGKVSRVAPPAMATGRVLAAGREAAFEVEGPHDKGHRTFLGPFATLLCGGVRIALTARPNAFLDPACFRAMGIDPAGMALVVTRSGYHFSLNYAAIGDCVTVDTPGMTSYRVADLPWRHARPFHPLDAVSFRPDPWVRRR